MSVGLIVLKLWPMFLDYCEWEFQYLFGNVSFKLTILRLFRFQIFYIINNYTVEINPCILRNI